VRQLPLLSPFLGLGPLFEFAIDLLYHVAQYCDASCEQTSNQQRLYGGLENRAFASVAESWCRILRQLIMGNRNQSPEFVEEYDLARLVCCSQRLRVHDSRCFRGKC